MDLIKISEGCELLCYADAVGVPTVGYGHTKTLKRADIGKKRITATEAERSLLVDLAHFEAQVAKRVKVKLTEDASRVFHDRPNTAVPAQGLHRAQSTRSTTRSEV